VRESNRKHGRLFRGSTTSICLCLHRNEGFHYAWSRKITSLQVLARTARPTGPSHLVPYHLTTTNPRAHWGCNLYNTNTMKGYYSSWSPKMAHNKFLELIWRCRSFELCLWVVKLCWFWEWEQSFERVGCRHTAQYEISWIYLQKIISNSFQNIV